MNAQVIAEMTDYQRELLMRLFRARTNEEVFPAAFDYRGDGEQLLRRGLIVATNGMYDFTPEGLIAWKAYRIECTASYADSRYRKQEQKERRKKLEAEKEAMVETLSDWEKQAMENLSPGQVNALRQCVEAGGALKKKSLNGQSVKSLMKYDYLEYDVETGKVHITDAGQMAFDKQRTVGFDEPLPPLKLGNRDNGDSQTLPDEPLPHSEEVEQDYLAHCDNCDGCVDHEVLHLLMKKYPAIGKLRKTVLETRKLMQELGLD